MIYLDVPYAQKDEAKALGARWDAGSKRWYVPKGALAALFKRWLPPGVTAKLVSKAAKPAKAAKRERPRERAARRQDDAAGKVIVGVNYVPTEGAVGLPWA